MKISPIITIAIVLSISVACRNAQTSVSSISNATETDSLPKPYATAATARISKEIGWPKNLAPKAPEGFSVTRFAEGLNGPRWIYQANNGDIFISEAKANQISLLRDANKDGKADDQKVYIKNLNQPFGMLILNGSFYIANTDGLMQFPYNASSEVLIGKGKKILDLPAGGYNNHWTRNLIANADGSKIYVSVGSGSNVGENGMENEIRRANILEINSDGSGERVFASGLRNPVGMDWNPVTKELWTAVNERDNLGDDLVPDYMTSVNDGGFYGWPYSYIGKHLDPRIESQKPELVEKAIVPDVVLGAHTASLGLNFYTGNTFPPKYKNGAFVGQHGSWNRSVFAGYKVIFVPFKDGKPSGKPEDFLTGFIANVDKNEVYGRPVCVLTLQDGSVLVADDSAGIIWRVSAK